MGQGAGLQVVDIADPMHPQSLGSAATSGDGRDVVVVANHACVIEYGGDLQVIDIADPAHPRLAGSIRVPGFALGVAASPDHIFVAAGNAGLQVVPAPCEESQSIQLVDFGVERVGLHAVARWTIAAPRDLAGFRIWREIPTAIRVLLGDAVETGLGVYEFDDDEPSSGPADYWLQELTLDGSENWYGPAHLEATPVPASLLLGQNRPNPFNPRTAFTFSLPRPGRVILAIYDARGAVVVTLVDTDLPASVQIVEWNGLNSRGVAAPSGVYFARLDTPAGLRTVKVTLAR